MESIALPESSVFTSYESTISGTVSTQGTPYRVSITINPNDSSFDVTLGWICIEYTVTS